MNKTHFFDYTAAVASVCGDMSFRVPELRHIDIARVAFSFSQTKNSAPFGIFATTVPLRFENGDAFQLNRKGLVYTVQKCLRSDGTEFLYILYFYVPRFIELPLLQKLETIVHELYHISPQFNGDLRRFPGRCFAHGSSQKEYDRIVSRLVQYWLKQNPPEPLWDFLRFNFRDLTQQFGKLHGTRIPFPKIIPANSRKEMSGMSKNTGADFKPQ
ncbi:MAG: hypothetical protein LBH00_08630 [Planctomycetaceae bacterium]|jgi:hypothetical protein|nr:hypothetical protein [Planctomycetaceae bacterium]